MVPPKSESSLLSALTLELCFRKVKSSVLSVLSGIAWFYTSQIPLHPQSCGRIVVSPKSKLALLSLVKTREDLKTMRVFFSSCLFRFHFQRNWRRTFMVWLNLRNRLIANQARIDHDLTGSALIFSYFDQCRNLAEESWSRKVIFLKSKFSLLSGFPRNHGFPKSKSSLLSVLPRNRAIP